MREIKQAKNRNAIKRVIGICACIVVSIMTSQAQEIKDIDALLAQEGFEDIQTKMVEDTLFAAFEDHSYRGTFRGAATAIKKVNEAHPEVENFELVLTDYKMPQLIVHASKRGGIWDVSVDRQMKEALQKLKGVTPQAASTGKIDITFFPQITWINNKLDHVFDYIVRIAPAAAVTLWKGSRLTIQPILPLFNNLKDYDENPDRYIQMGNTNLSQQLLSTKRWKATAAVGFFHPGRAGVHSNITFHALRNLDLYLEGGYTWVFNYTVDKGFGAIDGSQKFNFMAHASYYEPWSKVQVELQGGRFTYGDYGGRMDVTRHFAEYAIGVYGILTEGEHNFGFHFAIPFGGKRQKRNGFVRVRLPEYFTWNYSEKSNFKYALENMGKSYVTQPDQNHSAHYWEPAFVEEYVERTLNGTFQ